jgi:hypothetical protein
LRALLFLEVSGVRFQVSAAIKYQITNSKHSRKKVVLLTFDETIKSQIP